jgi:hypothetical protein
LLKNAGPRTSAAITRQEDGMALIITGTFIQFLCLAVQVIQLRLGRPRDPGPRRPAPVGGRTAPDHGETARASLELERQDPAGD